MSLRTDKTQFLLILLERNGSPLEERSHWYDAAPTFKGGPKTRLLGDGFSSGIEGVLRNLVVLRPRRYQTPARRQRKALAIVDAE